MSLPLKNDPNPAETPDPLPREDVGPKLIAMESYDPDIDVEDAAAEEVEAVLLRASESLPRAKPLHVVAGNITSAYDEAIQSTRASARRGVNAIRALGERDPLSFIAVVAAAAFVVGLLFRVGRSSRG
jgi:hypothetical protein